MTMQSLKKQVKELNEQQKDYEDTGITSMDFKATEISLTPDLPIEIKKEIKVFYKGQEIQTRVSEIKLIHDERLKDRGPIKQLIEDIENDKNK